MHTISKISAQTAHNVSYLIVSLHKISLSRLFTVHAYASITSQYYLMPLIWYPSCIYHFLF